MKSIWLSCILWPAALGTFTCLPYNNATAQQLPARMAPEIVSRVISQTVPPIHSAYYLETKGFRLRSSHQLSEDNGVTWKESKMLPDFMEGLPHGYRRNPAVYTADKKRIICIVNALDVPGLDPKIAEPRIAQQTYYLRYRVSVDGGKTWLFEDPIVQHGNFSTDNPFPGVSIGKNSIYVGDRGSQPIVSKDGHVLVPVQTTPMDADGNLWNPGNGHTYTDAVVLIGKWTTDNRITWTMSNRIVGDPSKSTRGMIEPTMVELPDGRLLMVMRGSNHKIGSSEYSMPSYKWFAVSSDGGFNWTKPAPFTFDDDSPFFSPSSMSALFKHSSGKYYWLGNLTEENCEGNLPRWPLVLAEVDSRTLKLIRHTAVTLDTFGDDDKKRGRLDISHFSVIEDRKNKEMIITYPRSYHAYKDREWVTLRVAVGSQH